MILQSGMASDDPKRPHRAQSATERDLDGIRARAERSERSGRNLAVPYGVPVIHGEPDPADFTPVTDVLSTIHNLELQRVVALVWQHTANMELRFRDRTGQDGGFEQIRELAEQLRARVEKLELADASAAFVNQLVCSQRARIEALELALVDVRGQSGNNGKLGNLRTAVDAIQGTLKNISSRTWGLLVAFLSGIGAGVIKLMLVGRAFGALENQVAADRAALDQQAAQILALQALAFHHPKDSP